MKASHLNNTKRWVITILLLCINVLPAISQAYSPTGMPTSSEQQIVAVVFLVITLIVFLMAYTKDQPKSRDSAGVGYSVVDMDNVDAQNLLSPGQRKEYQIGSARYYKKIISKNKTEVIRLVRGDEYQHVACPECHFVTARCIESTTTVLATLEADYHQAGEFKRSYACLHCHHAYHTVHTVPRLVSGRSASLATGGPQKSSSSNSSKDDISLYQDITVGEVSSPSPDNLIFDA